jgi:hypothetical protein
MAGVIERLEYRLVRPHIQLLHFVAGCVLLAGRAQDIDEAGHADFSRDHLRGQRYVVQQIAERSGRLRMLALLVDDVAFYGNNRVGQLGHSLPPVDSAARASTS